MRIFVFGIYKIFHFARVTCWVPSIGAVHILFVFLWKLPNRFITRGHVKKHFHGMLALHV